MTAERMQSDELNPRAQDVPVEVTREVKLESGGGVARKEESRAVEEKSEIGPSGAAVLAMAALAAIAADVFFNRGSILSSIGNLFRRNRAQEVHAEEKRKAELVGELEHGKIDPVTFDSLLTNEMNRRLKTRFGHLLLALTVLFTAASYVIVILNGRLGWNISEVAMTALVIEIPIQFFGLLYIVARNLFPQN